MMTLFRKRVGLTCADYRNQRMKETYSTASF